MKTFVIGDIHGCYDEFEGLLAKINADSRSDRLVLLGDYIDRGDKSFEVVNKIIKLQEEYGRDNIILLKGNHELMAVEYFEKRGSAYLFNGGNETIKSFRENGSDLKEYIEFFKGLRNYYQDDHFIYVHGGIRPGIKLEEQKTYDLVWIREEFYMSQLELQKTVIFGHTPTICINDSDSPLKIGNKMALDTGCVFEGSLSALEIADGKIAKMYQVKSEIKERKTWCA